MLLNALLLVLAATLESAACWLMVQAGNTSELLVDFFGAHAAASLVLAALVWRLLPRAYRQPPAAALLLPFVLSLFVPVLAMAGLLLSALLARWSRGRAARAGFGVVAAPEYRPRRHDGGAAAAPVLPPDLVSLDGRMKKLLAIQDLAPRRSSAVLRGALSDNADDLRLLAYGMLESSERKLMLRIQAVAALRRARPAEAPDYGLSRELAELHWELVYQNLVQGDMRRFALEQVGLYAREALAVRPDDGGLWLILGRCNMLSERFEQAETALQNAVAAGILTVRAEPYLAELAFLRRDYDTVRRLMRRNRPEVRLPQLRHATVFWGAHEAHS